MPKITPNGDLDPGRKGPRSVGGVPRGGGSATEDRLLSEAAFHDALVESDGRAADRFYAINGSSWSFYRELLLREASLQSSTRTCPRILEYGSGRRLLVAHAGGAGLPGRRDRHLAPERRGGAAACPRAVPERRARLPRHEREALDLPEASFDLVCGSGILHHLALERAYGEVARVLAPTGSAVFSEPLGTTRSSTSTDA